MLMALALSSSIISKEIIIEVYRHLMNGKWRTFTLSIEMIYKFGTRMLRIITKIKETVPKYNEENPKLRDINKTSIVHSMLSFRPVALQGRRDYHILA